MYHVRLYFETDKIHLTLIKRHFGQISNDEEPMSNDKKALTFLLFVGNKSIFRLETRCTFGNSSRL